MTHIMGFYTQKHDSIYVTFSHKLSWSSHQANASPFPTKFVSPRCYAQIFQGLAPEWLVICQGHHQLRHFGFAAGDDGADAPVVQGHGAEGQQPAVWHIAATEDMWVTGDLGEVLVGWPNSDWEMVRFHGRTIPMPNTQSLTAKSHHCFCQIFRFLHFSLAKRPQPSCGTSPPVGPSTWPYPARPGPVLQVVAVGISFWKMWSCQKLNQKNELKPFFGSQLWTQDFFLTDIFRFLLRSMLCEPSIGAGLGDAFFLGNQTFDLRYDQLRPQVWCELFRPRYAHTSKTNVKGSLPSRFEAHRTVTTCDLWWINFGSLVAELQGPEGVQVDCNSMSLTFGTDWNRN